MLTTNLSNERHDIQSATVRLSMFIDLIEDQVTERFENGSDILASARDAVRVIAEVVARKTDSEMSDD